MYTRTYNEDVGEIIIPERYGGTSFGQKSADESRDSSEQTEGAGKNPWENEESIHTWAPPKNEEAVEASSFKEKLSSMGIFSKIFDNGIFGLQKIGKEELLILATAAFLLFSKEGDKECAIMLILLLFLN